MDLSPMHHSTPARITRIHAKQLFGAFDHDIPLNQQARVTILHGINGVGKTKMLELTSSITGGALYRLAETPFSEFRIHLDDDTLIECLRDSAQLELQYGKRPQKPGRSRRRTTNTINLRRISKSTSDVVEHITVDFTLEATRLLARFGLPNWIEPIGPGIWIDRHNDYLLDESDLKRRYGIPWRALERLNLPPEKFSKVVPCRKAHLIETQRLLRIGNTISRIDAEDDEKPLRMAVWEIASELKRKIAAAQNEFARKTQALDRTLIERVLQAEVTKSGKPLRKRLEDLDQHRARLERVGLLDAGSFGPTLSPAKAAELSGDRALMISVHTDDAEQKFEILDSLANRLELFLNGMNEKLAHPKKLTLDSNHELAVQRNGERIPLEQLSSGEQHELVLLYDLTFRIEPNTLVLIDEPELSLHPAWQEQLLNDILKIADSGKFDVLLATHSPYVIGDRSDLCVELMSNNRTQQ